MTNASVRSSRLLGSFIAEGSSRSVAVDAEVIRKEEAKNENVDYEEKESRPVVDRLYMLYYKKVI